MSTVLLTRGEVAAQLRMSLRYVDALISTGQIEVVRMGRRVRVSADAVAKFVASVTEPAGLQPPEEIVRGRPRSRW